MNNLYRTPCVLVGEDELASLSNAGVQGVQVFGLADVGRHLRLLSLHGAELELETAPSLCLGLLTCSEANVPMLERAHQWLTARLVTHPSPPQLAVGPMSTAVIRDFVGERGVALASQFAAAFTSASRELAVIRQAHERLESSFQAMEAVLFESGLQPFELAFTNEPARSNEVMEIQQSGVRQVLPVSSLGLAGIALHVSGSSGRARGGLRVSLESLENKMLHATWLLGGSRLEPGWNMMILPQGIGGLRRTLRLHIDGIEEDGSFPLLSLGDRMPVTKYQISDATGQPMLGRALALQAWVGLSNVRPPMIERFWQPLGRHEPLPEQQYSIPLQALARVTMLSAEPKRPRHFKIVHFVEKRRSISCHPLTGQISFAGLQDVLPPGTSRVSALVRVENSAANDVEFALAAADTLAAAKAVLENGTSTETAGAASGWVRVKGGQSSQINLFFDEGREICNLVLATRMADGKADNYAVSQFSALRYWKKEDLWQEQDGASLTRDHIYR